MVRACLLAAAVCMDTCFAAISCTLSGIHIPKRSALIVSLVGTLFLWISLAASGVLAEILPAGLFRWGGGLLLCGMGLWQLLKDLLHKHLERSGSMQLEWKGVGLVVQICLDGTKADRDGSKTLSAAEAVPLAAALSLDSLVSGLGAGIPCAYWCVCLILTCLLGFGMTMLGSRLAQCRCLQKYDFLSGGLLLVLGMLRFF